MNAYTWRWARLKKDILMDDVVVLYLLRCGPFILPAGTIVWVRGSGSFINITLSPELIEEKIGAFILPPGYTKYNDLLEPLE